MNPQLKQIEDILKDVEWCKTFEVTYTPIGVATEKVVEWANESINRDESDFYRDKAVKKMQHWVKVLNILKRSEDAE